MAKIKHYSVTSILNETIAFGRTKKALHIHGECDHAGRKIIVNGKDHRNFGTCGYLGLEHHPKVCEAAIDAIRREGVHVSASRAFVSSGDYAKLEELLSQIFEAHVLVTPTTTLGHLAAIPVLVGARDMVILDQHVHASVSQAVQITKVKGTVVKTVRHNKLDVLEDFITKYYDQHDKIWYMIDGLFSMHGDLPDMAALEALLEKYPKLWLYADDAHGLSWAGKHGRGYVLSKMEFHQKLILSTSMKKAFGSGGGILVFANKEDREYVKNCGNSILFSGPLNSASLGAGIASAEIHLSDEIYQLQDQMRENVEYCNQLMAEADLPLLSRNESPIFFLAVGAVKGTYNLQQRLMEDGVYTNSSIFPAVPLKCSGVRFTVCSYHTKEDIKALIDSFAKHYPEVMREEEFSMKDLAKIFKRPDFAELNPGLTELVSTAPKSSDFSIQYENSISKIDKETWNSILGDKGSFDFEGVDFLEKSFQNHEEKENNWRFHYFLVKNAKGKVVTATFFTETLLKDDMFSEPSISMEVEKERKENPYYFTSLAFMMGSPITEGEHLYIDKSDPDWEAALETLLDGVWEAFENTEASQILIRDLSYDEELHQFLLNRDFIKITLPDANILEFPADRNEMTFEDYLDGLSKRKKEHIKRFVNRHVDKYSIRIIENISKSDLEHLYGLYSNVRDKNLDINVFEMPISFFADVFDSPQWDVVGLYLKAETDLEEGNGSSNNAEKLIGFAIVYHPETGTSSSPMIAGLDYEYLKSHAVYRQLIYQIVKFGWDKKADKIYFGFSANIEKGKLGAVPVPKVAYMYTNDSFSLEVLSSMKVSKVERHY